ncbi:MAG: outer membrane protein assembly factor BamA [Porticoccaceae bacterium]
MIKIRLFLSLVLLCPAIALAQAFTIEDLRVEGLQRVSAGSVFAAVPVRVGDQADEGVIQDTIRSLFQTGFFDDIAVYRDANVLVIEVSERPAIAEINLEGNKVLKDEDLLESLRDQGLSEGQIFRPATLDALGKELSRVYVSQGHYGAEIETEVRELPRNRVAIDINIGEGEQARIKEINIVGNQTYEEDELLDLFESGVTGWFGWFSSKDKYSREKLTGDLETLESHYLDAGYLRFNIDSTQVSVSSDKLSVFVTVNISEGDLYTVSSVDHLGDMVIPEALIRIRTFVREGQRFSQALITASKDAISNSLNNEGYAFAEVDEILDINDEEKTVDVTFFINPQMRTYVRRIEFRGNTRTQGEVLRREMRQMESAVASSQLIETGEVRLNRLGFFSSVESETEPVPGTNDEVDVIYTVEEQPSGSISASLGYAQSVGAILGLNLQENNFLGSGNSVGLGVNRSTYQQSLNFSYADPYFTEDGVSAGYSVYLRRTDYGELRIASFTNDVAGLSVNFGYPLSEISRLSLGFGYENLKVDIGSFASDEIKNFVTDNATFNQFKLSSRWSRVTLNRGIFATRGSSQSLGMDVAVPGSDAPYAKVTYDAQKYVPLGPLTFRLSTTMGIGQSLDSEKRLPFFENYYGGGFGSVRGFERSTLGPRESPAYQISEDGEVRLLGRADPIGGNVLVTGTAEMLIPLPFLPNANSVRATAFVDAGNVFDTDCGPRQAYCYRPKFEELRYSYGLSASWLSGFGPMSFSFGRSENAGTGLLNVRDEESEFFQFSLGQTF